MADIELRSADAQRWADIAWSSPVAVALAGANGCFAVRRVSRGQGVGVALLDAAVCFAQEHGARVLDGHPVEVDALAGEPTPAALFTGTMRMNASAGFAEIGRTYRTRASRTRRAYVDIDIVDLG